MTDLVYPASEDSTVQPYGLFPVDFVIETVLAAGLDWFKNTPEAPRLVYGHLYTDAWLSKYGSAKVAEIADFINNKQPIKIVQHFSLIAENVPCISIQLLDGGEDVGKTGLTDFAGQVDTFTVNNELSGRKEVGFEPMNDSIHIGIHNAGTPDLTKYIYYLVVYILNMFKDQLNERGLQLGTFRATDVSRLNEYLPQNIFSRFINVSYFTMATFDKGSVPLISEFTGVNVDVGLKMETIHEGEEQ